FAGPDGGILRASAFRARVWYPAVVRAGLSAPRPTPHSLRHSAIAAWIAVGVVDPLKLARWAGHRDVSTIYRFYGHLLPCDAAAERAALAELRHAARPGSALRHELAMPRELAEGG
ncbi:MAG: site-specific integrase, partial [Acidimicrobiales bacterium]